MLKTDGNNFSKNFTLSLWLLMAFQAGYINVGGFMIFGNFVSHVTGTSSQIGMGIASIDYKQIVTFVTILLAFIGGASFAGHFLGRRIEEGKEPLFTLVTFIKAALFGLILILSEFYFNQTSTNVTLLIVFLLSVCCGIQNSTCSIATNGFLKPTHMTGLSTDIGIHLTKVFAWRKDKEKYQEELKKNYTRIGILAFFIFGGIIAYMIFSQNGHYGFLFPFISSMCILNVSIQTENRSRETKPFVYKLAKNSIWGTFLITITLGIYHSLG